LPFLARIGFQSTKNIRKPLQVLFVIVAARTGRAVKAAAMVGSGVRLAG
jgi:hypothetical protein